MQDKVKLAMPKYHTQIFGLIAGRIGIQTGLISQSLWIRFPPPQLIKLKTMTKDGKVMTCIVSQTVRNIVAQANELEIPREDIISMFALGGQIYLVFYK